MVGSFGRVGKIELHAIAYFRQLSEGYFAGGTFIMQGNDEVFVDIGHKFHTLLTVH